MAQIYPHIPTGLHGLVKMFEMWTYSLFFCCAELWGAVVISVLAWSLANEVCTVPEAKTVYPLVGIAANIALVVAGNFMKLVNRTVIQVRMSWMGHINWLQQQRLMRAVPHCSA